MTEAVMTAIEDGIAVVTLNRPDKLNALDTTLAEGLRAAMLALEVDEDVRAVVIMGSGGHFMAGGDLFQFKGWLDQDKATVRNELDRLLGEVHRAIHAIKRMGKPVIASVEGAAAGFGLSLMLACDLAVASKTAVFTLAYINIGTSPDGGATYSLPRLVGTRKAMELALLGDRFDAATAFDLGLVNRLAEPEVLQAETMALARRLANGPRRAVATTKRLINRSLDSSLADQIKAEEEGFAGCAVHADFSEGVTAFTEKRKPKYS